MNKSVRMGLIAVAIVASVWAAYLLARLVADMPSCEDQGMKSVFQYFMPMVQMVGKIPVTQLFPVYACQ